MICCRVPSTLRPLLGNTGAPKDELYSEEQIRSVLAAYVSANGLDLGGGSIKLDKLMISNLFNKKEPQLEGDPCPVEEVVKRLLGKLQLFHKVTRVTEQARMSSIRLLALTNGGPHIRHSSLSDLRHDWSPVSTCCLASTAARPHKTIVENDKTKKNTSSSTHWQSLYLKNWTKYCLSVCSTMLAQGSCMVCGVYAHTVP